MADSTELPMNDNPLTYIPYEQCLDLKEIGDHIMASDFSNEALGATLLSRVYSEADELDELDDEERNQVAYNLQVSLAQVSLLVHFAGVAENMYRMLVLTEVGAHRAYEELNEDNEDEWDTSMGVVSTLRDDSREGFHNVITDNVITLMDTINDYTNSHGYVPLHGDLLRLLGPGFIKAVLESQRENMISEEEKHVLANASFEMEDFTA